MIQEYKKFSNWILRWSGAPPESWFLIFEYLTFIMNRTARRILGWRTPYEALHGQTPDISMLLHFKFWEKVAIKNYQAGKNFPSQPNEITVHFVGFAETVGHSMTFKVWNPTTKKLLFRSQLKKLTPEESGEPSREPEGEPSDGNTPEIVRLRQPDDDDYKAATIDPLDLVGRTFLMPVQEDGQRLRATIVGFEEAYEGQVERHPERTKFRVKVGDEEFEDFAEYNDMCDFIEEQVQNPDGTWKFRRIIGHTSPDDNGPHKVLIEWESGERTFEPISEIYRADKWLLAEYAKENDLLDAWDSSRVRVKQAAKNCANVLRLINQARMRSNRATPIFKYGHQVPRSHDEAMELDRKNGNTKWRDSEALEIFQLKEYSTFNDIGHRSQVKPPDDHKKISLHFVYDVKHDGRYKSRIVAGGHLTDVPLESVYSGVVSLRGVRTVVFLAELNNLLVWQTDIGNAYLESMTKEKVYVIAGPEFVGQEGNIFIISRALYGLKSSGLRWHERFSDVLRSMHFFPSKGEHDIWMRKTLLPNTTDEYYYEYIAVYVDDLTIASKDPQAIVDILLDVHKFKLKGTGPLNFLLGCDYFRDSDNILCYAPKKYISKMIDVYKELFGETPRPYLTPLEKGDHPELDETELLDAKHTQIYQSLIGATQWIIQLGRFDIATHVMSLSSFRAAPRHGHLMKIRRVYGYLSKFRNSAIRVRTDEPDLSDVNFFDHDWSYSPYAGSQEVLPKNIPPPLGKHVTMTTYVDANLCHNFMTGKAVTGVLHFFNKTPTDWFSKTQATVETATYGAEYSAARTAVEQIRANKLTLLYLGVPVRDGSVLFGDNKTVVDGSTHPHGKLHKRHHMLSYHFVREAIASGAIKFAHVPGSSNPADILSKHWGHQCVWKTLQPILFYQGDTMTLED